MQRHRGAKTLFMKNIITEINDNQGKNNNHPVPSWNWNVTREVVAGKTARVPS